MAVGIGACFATMPQPSENDAAVSTPQKTEIRIHSAYTCTLDDSYPSVKAILIDQKSATYHELSELNVAATTAGLD